MSLVGRRIQVVCFAGLPDRLDHSTQQIKQSTVVKVMGLVRWILPNQPTVQSAYWGHCYLAISKLKTHICSQLLDANRSQS